MDLHCIETTANIVLPIKDATIMQITGNMSLNKLAMVGTMPYFGYKDEVLICFGENLLKLALLAGRGVAELYEVV